MYLYQDLNRRSSTIDGYRTAIVDTLGPTGLHISQSSHLNRLLSSFHRDRPKSSRNLPKWNLSVVLNELTKAPFKPMKDTYLKHLTLKTAFLLALASGKRRSEIHAWVANKVSRPMGKGCFVPLFRFHSQKPTSKRRFLSVSPVTIPALTTIVDRQTPYTLFLAKTNYHTLLQTSRPTSLGLGPLRPLRPFTVGCRTKSCKRVTGKLTPHLQIFT